LLLMRPPPRCSSLFPYTTLFRSVFEAHEDLGARVGIEWRLEPHLELVRIEVVPLHPRRVAIGPNVAGRADFGVELRLAALASNELRAPGGVTPDSAGVGARRSRGGGAQGGERRVGRRLGGRRAMSELRPHAVEPRLECPNLHRERATRRWSAGC